MGRAAISTSAQAPKPRINSPVMPTQSYYVPRRPDGTAMTQVTSGSSPFDYVLEITPDLKTVVSTAATGWQ